jgi:hypothetical protein
MVNGYGHKRKVDSTFFWCFSQCWADQRICNTDSPKYMLLIYYINFWNPHGCGDATVLFNMYVRAMLVQYILTYISSILRNEILEEEKIVLDL